MSGDHALKPPRAALLVALGGSETLTAAPPNRAAAPPRRGFAKARSDMFEFGRLASSANASFSAGAFNNDIAEVPVAAPASARSGFV